MSNLHSHSGPKSLGQSLSMGSLLSVESDSSAPPPVAPPRSAQLNTGEVLQPYQPMLSAAHHSLHGSPGRPPNVMTGRSPSANSFSRVPHQHSMAVVNSQSALREAPPSQAEPPQESPQSTWVIEEVIDFGVPLDEGMVRECDDSGYPLGCKSLGPNHRGNATLFDGCVHGVCYDEQVVEMHDDPRDSTC